ncbi:MAG: hypothetical protein FWD79_09665 [Desulfobulbus sp.]|nr:hypothetical protein [Desulfobulbus sp.]
MKKVLVTGAALMLAGGIATTAAVAADEPGVKITGDARIRLYYVDSNFRNFNNSPAYYTDASGHRQKISSQTNMDSRVRVVMKGTTAGGTYAVVRMRIGESLMGDVDGDYSNNNTFRNSNIAADMAYVGIPFTQNFTLELGRYRSTYGPLPGGFNFFYDDVNLTGARGIIKFGNVEINPFAEWMVEAQNPDGGATVTAGATAGSGVGTNLAASADDTKQDNDEIRFGVHAKMQVNKDWLVGGMVGYQMDNRNENTLLLAPTVGAGKAFEPNKGFFGSLYVNGKAGNFGLVGEVAVTAANLNNFNSWEQDLVTADRIGSKDTGFGGFIFPNYQIDKWNIGLNLGFTTGGFQPDGAFGDGVLLGTIDNSVISTVRIGDYGDWLWAGLVVSYQFTDALKLTGNFFYANIDAWDSVGPDGDGPNTGFRSLGKAISVNGFSKDPIDITGAWTLSGMLQWTVSKGTDIFFSAGYLKPSIDNPYNVLGLDDKGVFAAATRVEIKF